MTDKPGAVSPFDGVFDVVVVGSGFAGFAAVMAARAAGRSVLLVGSHGDLVWESGRGLFPVAGECADLVWSRLWDGVDRRGGLAAGWVDGAVAEVVATDLLMDSGASVLYYARPVGVESSGGVVTGLSVATRTGVRRVSGAQWVDATETGELLRLVSDGVAPRVAERAVATVMLQHADWSSVSGADGLVSPTVWPTERMLQVEVPAGDPGWREEVVRALSGLESVLGAQLGQVSVSHLSIQPVAQYAAGAVGERVVGNVVSASPQFTGAAVFTLADRYQLGLAAVELLAGVPVGQVVVPEVAPEVPAPVAVVSADVCVVGAGTGGVFAAMAASSAGARVVTVDPLLFVGGIGSGGGIHGYYFGMAGGLQEQVDDRIRELMKSLHGGPFGDGPFNPWAKMITLERLLREQAVDTRLDALVFHVEKQGDRVTAVLAATPDGVLRIEAAGFVDGTGDGDLCALAGADYTFGREHDGQLHAYSQSSGRLREINSRPRMIVVNFDAGFCDPTDTVDLTRARLEGVRQYLLEEYENLSRPTYIAPALGLRQGRHVVTEYVLTFDDTIRRRRFDDVIGFTGAHYDNHATDIEFESDEAVFWVWANHQFATPLACELSYRMIVPKGLDNVWIGSRCLGVTQDAHPIVRMQRDMQRVGEAAGYAAAEAARTGATANTLTYDLVRSHLERSGALDKPKRGLDTFGSFPYSHPMTAEMLDEPSITVSLALEALDRGESGEAIWWLYQHPELVGAEVRERLTSAAPATSWLAASIVAMWGDPAAQPRLITAIEQREEVHSGASDSEVPVVTRSQRRLVPNWLAAIAMLRRCGTAESLSAIQDLLDGAVPSVDTLATIALTIKRLAERGALDQPEDLAIALEILEQVTAIPALGAVDVPSRDVARFSVMGLDGDVQVVSTVDFYTRNPDHVNQQRRQTQQDATWQLHLAAHEARLALGLPPLREAHRWREHERRALVRRAFSRRSATIGRVPGLAVAPDSPSSG